MAKNMIKKAESFTTTNDYNLLKQFSQLKTDLRAGVPDEKLLKSIDDLKTSLTKSDAKIDAEQHVYELLDRTKALISNSSTKAGELSARRKPAKLDEMLEIYQKLSPAEYAKIEKNTANFIKSLDESINIESEQFFDKVRDLQIGSAPTDALSILGSAAMIGVGLARAKIMMKEYR